MAGPYRVHIEVRAERLADIDRQWRVWLAAFAYGPGNDFIGTEGVFLSSGTFSEGFGTLRCAGGQ